MYLYGVARVCWSLSQCTLEKGKGKTQATHHTFTPTVCGNLASPINTKMHISGLWGNLNFKFLSDPLGLVLKMFYWGLIKENEVMSSTHRQSSRPSVIVSHTDSAVQLSTFVPHSSGSKIQICLLCSKRHANTALTYSAITTLSKWLPKGADIWTCWLMKRHQVSHCQDLVWTYTGPEA